MCVLVYIGNEPLIIDGTILLEKVEVVTFFFVNVVVLEINAFVTTCTIFVCTVYVWCLTSIYHM